MPDILASGDYGRDDGIECSFCKGKTYLVDDQGYGLCSYQCEECGESFGVQFDYEYDEDDGDEFDYWEGNIP